MKNLFQPKYFLFIFILLSLPFQIASSKPVKNVVIMIADGFGPAGATLARSVNKESLFLDSILVGTIRTNSSDSLITDSAAAATAYATGYKTNNGVIAMSPNGLKKLETIMELARKKSMATGIVVKDNLPGATPGAFSAHSISRDLKSIIALQQIDAGFDLIFGGGKKYFKPPYNLDLINIAKLKGINIIVSKQDLYNLSKTPAVGFFNKGKLDYAIDNNQDQPTLPEMTKKALELLSKNNNGFILMIEGSKIDTAAHDNDVTAYAKEILEYDNTVAEVINFINNNPDTLMISVADHETGGVTIGADINNEKKYEYNLEIFSKIKHSTDYLANLLEEKYSIDSIIQLAGLDDLDSATKNIIKTSKEPIEAIKTVINNRSRTGWTTRGHTGVDINLYAYGAGSEAFRGNYDNTEINHMLVNMLNLKSG